MGVIRVTDCSEPIKIFSPFDDSFYDTANEECTWKEGEISSYAKSSEAFWKEVEGRKEAVNIENIVKGF